MPKLQTLDPNDPNHQNIVRVNTGSTVFSAVHLDKLRASKFTLSDVSVDCSQSVEGFKGLMENMLTTICTSLRESPYKNNLLTRVHTFTDPGAETEIHGFVPVMTLDPNIYQGALKIGVMTALYDADYDGLSAIGKMGADLAGRNYECNYVQYVITDGDNNRGTTTPGQIAALAKKIHSSETLESGIRILIGVNIKEPHLKARLEEYKNEGGFTHFIAIEDASKASLDKLAEFISSSVSSTSQALGGGGPSQMIAPGASITI